MMPPLSEAGDHAPISIFRFSFFHTPPEGVLMVALTAYLDDSGCPDDPNGSSVIFAGYAAKPSQWTAFEPAWRAVLADKKVPYLHMKEFAKPGSALNKLTEPERIDLLSSLTAVIKESGLKPLGTIVRHRDVTRFNREHSTCYRAKSLGVLVSILSAKQMAAGEICEILLDRMQKATGIIEMAFSYADFLKKLHGHDVRSNVGVFQAPDYARNVFGLQAADFLAYEIKKHTERSSEWYETEKPGLPPEEWLRRLVLWSGMRFGLPGIRKSYAGLLEGESFSLGLVDYDWLCDFDDKRNGRELFPENS